MTVPHTWSVQMGSAETQPTSRLFRTDLVRRMTSVRWVSHHCRAKRCLIYVDQRLLSGDMCCFDLEAADQWKHGQDKWRKKCCNNPSGSPVIRPKGKMEPWQIEKVNKYQWSPSVQCSWFPPLQPRNIEYVLEAEWSLMYAGAKAKIM